MGCSQITFMQKNPSQSFGDLSPISRFSNLVRSVVCTVTYFYLALVALGFFLLVVHPTKPLSPGDWTHLNIFGPCNDGLSFLSRFGFLRNLHQQVSGFTHLALPSSPSPKETLIWKFWPPEEMPRCPWHFIKQVMCMARFGIVL